MHDRKIVRGANVFAKHRVLNYWTYLVGATFIVLVPGLNTLFVLKNSVSGGMKGGYLAACGVFTDDAVLMFLVQAGVATLIKTTPTLFNIVCYLGTFYLLYLGSKILYAILKGKNSGTKSDEPQYGAIFKHALTSSLANPKAVLLYVSFFIQFIDVNASHTGISFPILATTLELVSFCYLSFLIISGTSVTQYTRTKKKLVKVDNPLIGLVFVSFAARLATLQSWCFQPALPWVSHL